jgi:hypothetical protein
MKAILALALILAACRQQAAPVDSNRDQPAPAIAPSPPAKPFTYEDKTDLFEFDFSWSAEAAAVPELVRRFRSEMDKSKAALVAGATADRDRRKQEGFPFNPYSSTMTYATAGQSPRLLSLTAEGWEYTGGAHGNGGTSALLWDRAARREVKFADLFVQPANRDRLLTQRWCDALNREREEKRGEPVGGGGMFDDCPRLDDLAIVPTDKDKDGRFETLLLVASPYVAGPYVEGSYEVPLAVTADLVAALKSEFQPSFAAQGRQ